MSSTDDRSSESATWSELTPCNAHLREVADRVKRGVWEAGGFPLEFPVMSMGETNIRPTAMLFRNLVSMDVEESIRGNPVDGVVLLCGCDKTTPSLMMGAASCDVPAIVVSGGPCSTAIFTATDRFGHRGVADERGCARGQDEDRRFLRSRGMYVAVGRPLHDHGDRVDHGQHGGSARHGPAA